MFSSTKYLYPNAVKQQGKEGRLFATLVDAHGDCTQITFADLDNASNRAAWFLQDELPSEKTFFYMGPNDIRYLVWVLAAMKTGKCVVFASLANQVPANRRFFQSVGAGRLLYAPESTNVLGPLFDATHDVIKAVTTPSYREILRQDVVKEYPFDATFQDLQDVKFMGLHTSGTSGHPKPIYWTHAAATVLSSALDPSFSSRDAPNLLRELWESPRLFVSFPLSHLAGMGPALGSIHYPSTIILAAPGTALSPPNLATILTAGSGCTAAFAPPAILEAILTHPDPRALAALSRLEKIAYTGGPLNPSRGRRLADAVSPAHLFPVLASTEGGPGQFVSSSSSPSSKNRWDSFRFVDVGQRMDEVSPGLYELVFPRTKAAERGYAFFRTVCRPGEENDGEDEYRTKDLLSPVVEEVARADGGVEKTMTGWWRYRGRADNWIVMSNGLKMDPTTMEATVSSHPEVSGVVVAGAHRFRLCMLVELRKPTPLPSPPPSTDSCGSCTGSDEEEKQEGETRAALEERLWPIIAEANRKAPKYGRVPRELIIYADPEKKPFLRAAKGTIQRRLTVDAYASEIDEMYTKVEGGLVLASGIPLPKSTEKDDLVVFLRNIYLDALQLGDDGNDDDETSNNKTRDDGNDDDETSNNKTRDDGNDMGLDDDLFTIGLDSLATFIVTARIRAGLRAVAAFNEGEKEAKLEQVNHKLIYSANTINRMAEALFNLFSPSSLDTTAQNHHPLLPKNSKLEQENLDTRILLEKYEAQLDETLDLAANSAQPDGKHNEDDNDVKGQSKSEEDEEEGETILMTGSTGSLGTYILHSLLSSSSSSSSPPPRKIILLTRSPNPEKTQSESFLRRGLPDWTKKKITAASAAAGKNATKLEFIRTYPTPRNPLGVVDIDNLLVRLLKEEGRGKPTTTKTTIIHAAYPVNFLLGTRSFEMAIGAWVGLLGIASSVSSSSSARKVGVFFISSITAGVKVVPPPPAAASQEEEEEEIPEAVLDGIGAERLLPQGYARSKFICERLLERWAMTMVTKTKTKKKGSSSGTVLRVGQVCGPVGGGGGGGSWNRDEWVPSLVISSVKCLGVVPWSLGDGGGGGGGGREEKDRGEVDWVPVDQLGGVVAELVLLERGKKSRKDDDGGDGDDVENFVVHNVVNPNKSSWGDVVVGPILEKEKTSGSTTIAVVSPREWVERLKMSGNSQENNPASRLVEFYEQLMLGGGGGGRERGDDDDISNHQQQQHRRPPRANKHNKVQIDSLLRVSETARNNMSRITGEDMKRWMKGWGL